MVVLAVAAEADGECGIAKTALQQQLLIQVLVLIHTQ